MTPRNRNGWLSSIARAMLVGVLASGLFGYPAFLAAQAAHVSAIRGAAAKTVKRMDTPGAANFGSVNVGATSAPMSVTLTFSAQVTLGSIAVLTQGAPNLDFANAGTGSCAVAKSYSSGDTCTVGLTFTPTLVGPRYGAAVLSDNSGNVIATDYAQGVGSGPQMNFLPGVERTIAVNGLSSPNGVAVDGGGNLYIADWNNSRVLKETMTAGGFTESTIVGSLTEPTGVAVDGAGNVYIAAWASSQLLKETWSGSGYTQTTIGSGLYNPNQVTIDGGGNVYVADSYNNRVLLETLSGGSYTQTTIFSGQFYSGIALDAEGNLYITAYDNGQVIEEMPSAGGYTQSSIGTGLTWPSNIAIDGGGNLYIADTLNSRIVKETPSASGYIQSVVPSSNLDWPWGVAADQYGNLFISDSYNHRLLKEDYWDPPSLDYTSTNNGPQTVTVENLGNAALGFPVPGSGNNPSISSDFTLDSSVAPACPVVSAGSSAPATLAAGAFCKLTIGVASVGTFSGSLVLTDNNLNAVGPAYATQTIALAAAVSSTTTLSASATQVEVGQPITLTATVTVPAGSGSPTGQVTFNGAGTPAPIATLNGSGVAVFSSSTLAAGSYSVTAVYSGDDTHLGSSSQAVAFTVNGFASFTALSASATQITAGQPITLTATVTGSAGSATPTGQVTFAGAGSPSPVASLNGSGVATFTSSTLAVGGYSVTANYGGDATHNPSQSQPVSFSVVSGPPAKVTPVGGPTWDTQYGAALGLCAEVTDANGDPVGGITVSFTGAELTFSPLPAVSNTSGDACTWASALAAGSLVATASVTGVATPATFDLTVTPAPLKVELAENSRLYGAPNPVFTMGRVRGLLNGDTISVTATTTATLTSPVGYYPITETLGGPAGANYTVENHPTLYVRKAVLTVFPDSEGVVTYGQSPPPPTCCHFEGFVNGDTAGVVSGAPVLTTTVTSTTPVGRYLIDSEVGTLTAANYTFLMEPGVVQVYKAMLTVVANNLTMTQGSAVPPLTNTLTGFVNGDTASVVSGAPVLLTTATSSSPPGQYPITAGIGDLSAANYAFGPTVNGVLTVTP
jgi:sugar lactone lactonase YvrE